MGLDTAISSVELTFSLLSSSPLLLPQYKVHETRKKSLGKDTKKSFGIPCLNRNTQRPEPVTTSMI